MALPDLILPQATDNVIQSADIALVRGVAVSIPYNVDIRKGDVIHLWWNTRLIAAKIIIYQEQEFPVVFLVPDEFISIGQYSIRYETVDHARNIVSSNVVTVTIE